MQRFILLFLLSLAACNRDEPQNAAQIVTVAEANVENGNSAKPAHEEEAPAPAPQPRVAVVGSLHIPYDAATLVPLPAKVGIPPDWKIEVQGIKFLARDRAALIGKAECIYGQSGKASLCNVQQEAGISFAALDIPYDSLKSRLPLEQRKELALAGVTGTSWQIGAEGEGAEYILLPAARRTILIVRQFRTSGNPDEAALGTLLGDLKLKAPA